MAIIASDLFDFKLDDFQLEAIEHLEQGLSVVVCAPTGSGKTVVAEYAVELALATGKRCFYTTPLKALSNQKLYDFQKRYGEDKLGLLTGDLSINRDAPIVVMTTEVFRNMLYGTMFGDVKRSLHNVGFVILDECHYMNDTARGTVWEESIIYSPKDIQIVALSATIANSDELTNWINETHGPTKLVLSDHRPVPLRFYYYGDRQLYPLLNPGGGLNPSLKNRFSARRCFQHKGKARPSIAALGANPSDVLSILSARNMLPAIYFLFSRRGCEESMRKARGIPLLSQQEQTELAFEIEGFTKANPNLNNHPHLPYLFEGMSVHHAGMLPSWKAMVEKLFQKGLLKVIFATETLAAGINMPARTTVISSISKRDDAGQRALNASEFLQMSGRAGRRGMDEVGYVVVAHHPFESVEDAAKLATARANALVSRFTPSYGMVLNLLERHSQPEAKDLIERSFGQFIINEQLTALYEQKMLWERELTELSHPLCPGELGDLPLYAKRLEAIKVKHKQLKQTEKGLKGQAGMQAKNELHKEISLMLDEAYGMPCHGCPVQKPCSKQSDRIKQLERRIKESNRRIEQETNKYWHTFEVLANILRLMGYLDGDKPTALGKLAIGIRGTNELFLSEVAVSGILEDLKPAQLAAMLTCLITEGSSRQQENQRLKISHTVESAFYDIQIIARKLHHMQRDFEVDISIDLSPQLAYLTERWAEGADWDEMRMIASGDEGDVVRSLRRTLDLCRQFIRAPGMPDALVKLCMDAEMLLARDEVKEDF